MKFLKSIKSIYNHTYCVIKSHDISIEDENELFELEDFSMKMRCCRCKYPLIATRDKYTETYTIKED